MKYLLSVLLGLSVSFSLRAVTLQEAKAYVVNGQYPQAVTAFRSLMTQPKYQKNAECNKLFGQSLCMTGAYAEAVPFLEFATQKAQKGAWWYLGICHQHLYDFDGAIQALEKYRATLPKNSLWLDRTDSILAECQVGLKGVSHVQDVVIIDSLLVPKNLFFTHYMLGAESGRLLNPANCGAKFSSVVDTTETVVFENQAADYRLLVCLKDSVYGLYESHLFADEWEEPRRISSIQVGQRHLCYPFLRSDSETLYFACDSTPGYGGLDIYKTHYSTDTESYYTPERLGMPFNSPYDDYMMAIDETHQVGWWATNRNTTSDLVCIYLFRLEDTPKYLEGRNPDRGRIASIADSWRRKEGYEALVEEIRNAPQFLVEQEVVRIPISDAVIYTGVDQFRSSEARAAYEQSLQVEESLLTVQGELDSMRQEYRSANAKRRKELQPVIVQAEQTELQLISQLKSIQKKYRSLEIGSLAPQAVP
ncbi:MAG: tetratricopeptide repeat protein [Bacteroidales bacterium]|nr:tetratricopeptide repeat protein [Bacteroidales bacterium]